MAAGEWLSSRAEGEANRHELEKEKWHHQTIAEHENADMCQMLQESGLTDELAQRVTDEVAAMPLDQVRHPQPYIPGISITSFLLPVLCIGSATFMISPAPCLVYSSASSLPCKI
jgi:hypothetical protein